MHGVRVRRMIAAALVAALAVVAAPLGSASAAPSAGTEATKDPVIIVAGTLAGQTLASVYYQPLAARLRADGYRVSIFGLPGSGLGDIGAISANLDAFADSVRAQTGATRVDLIGHSQGGLVSRHYVKYRGGANEVDRVISLGAPHYGAAVANLLRLLGLGSCAGVVACQQMAIGSPFLAALNAGDDTIGNVRYTNLASVVDGIVQPYTTSFLANDGNNTNVLIQQQCPFRAVGHVALPLDGTVYSGIQDALANQPITLRCLAL